MPRSRLPVPPGILDAERYRAMRHVMLHPDAELLLDESWAHDTPPQTEAEFDAWCDALVVIAKSL